jgi:hypothetical protein
MGVMKLVKLFLISVLVLAAIITAISTLFPSTVVVSRAIEVNAPPDKIAYYIADLNHWNEWMTEWKENKVVFNQDTAYIGTQKIHIAQKTDSSVRINWIATGQSPYIATIEWLPLQEGTYVIHWSFEQHVKWYPWEKFQTLLNEKLLGGKMELELQHLQAVIH